MSAANSSVSTGCGRQSVELLLREELRDRGAELAALVPDDVREALRAAFLRELLECPELGARVRPRHAQEPDRVGAGEDAELRAARELRRVLELEPEARVGLVGPEAPVGLGEGHPRPRRGDLDIEALAPDRGEHLLHQPEQHLAVGKAHLDVELRDLLDAIGAEVLVAEADRDLVVAVEAGDHRQLLEGLRALREREEPPLVQAARDDEVARALGRRLVEDRRLDVEEPGRLHVAADDPDHLRPQPDVPLQLLAAQVEPAIAQAQRLVDVLLVELERQRRRAGDDRQLVDGELDVTGRHLRVDRLGGARDELPARLEDELVADLSCERGRLGRSLRIDHELRDARSVAQVDEHEPAVVATAGRPAGECHRPPGMLEPRLAAHHVPPAHAESLETISAWSIGSSSRPGCRSDAVSDPTTTMCAAPRRRACVSCPLSERPA